MTSKLFGDGAANIPAAVLARAEELFDRAVHAPDLPGDSDVLDGYWIETHTIGCRNHADDPQDEWWKAHWAIHDRYAGDGMSLVAGDPADGAFVTITPQRGTPPFPPRDTTSP